MDEKKCNISIIVPIYNVGKWLTRCLSSIHYQTYKNFEVLLIDDGSSDNSSEICKSFLKKDHRFIYHRKVNGGLSDARNYGIDRAKGKYIIFIDSDDYIEKEYVEKLYQCILDNKADVIICGFKRVNEDGKVIDVDNLCMTNKKILNGEEIIELSFDVKNSGWALACAWNKIYNRRLFDGGLRFAKNRYYEDGYIFPHLFLKVKKAVLIHQSLYNYVQRNNSIMHSVMNIKKIKDDDYSMQSWIKLFKNTNKKLYILSIQKYKGWILNKWCENRELIVSNNMADYLQEQYRKYVRINHSGNFKTKAKDMLAYVNLDLFFYFRKLLRK